MKILGYRIIKESEYQRIFSAIQVAHRVGELQRWLNPWRMVYGNIFKFIQTGNTQVESAREQILNDYMSVHREGVEKENSRNRVKDIVFKRNKPKALRGDL